MKIKPEKINENYSRLCKETAAERAALFTEVARSKGANPIAIEKDLYVCRVIDAIFNGLSQRPKPFFKGGTSLSKGYGIINRFSEDIDIVISNKGLGIADLVDPNLSGEARRRLLSATAQNGLPATVRAHTLKMQEALAELLPDLEVQQAATPDRYGAALRIAYKSVLPEDGTIDSYISRSVLVEIGARSIKEPTAEKTIRPYVSERLEENEWNLSVSDVTLICAERTFWDKIYIMDNFCRNNANNREIALNAANRISRHYYDVAMSHDSSTGRNAIRRIDIQESVKNYFEAPAAAIPGSLYLLPPDSLLPLLERDYNEGTSRMVFGVPVSFDEIKSRLERLNEIINGMPLRIPA